MTQFQIHRSDPTRTRVVETTTLDDRPLQEGEAKVHVQHFGFSANNMTYAVLGESFGYWRFFPAADDETGEWGVVPVWGYAEVVDSRAPAVEVGDRLFGYFPTADHLVLRPEGHPGRPVVDTMPHRAELPPAYNSYQRVEPGGARAQEDLRMLLFPLYLTSWAIVDMLQSDGWSGSEQLVVTSASSKTAIGLAYAARAADQAPTIVGLTSGRNRALVEGLGLYDRVVDYDQLEQEVESRASVVVDMAGDGAVLGRLHRHLGTAMLRSVGVGITHWEERGRTPDVLTERSEIFFAPSVIVKRTEQWGAREFSRRTEEFIAQAANASAAWLRIEESVGIASMSTVYESVRAGSVPPDVGLVLRT